MLGTSHLKTQFPFSPTYSYADNSFVFFSGIVKLKMGDHLELLIPRSSASVSLDEDSTFLGAVKLG